MKKLVALLLAMVMLCCMCSFAVAEEAAPEGYPEIIKDKDGNTVDLGGIEVLITDYWSAADGARNEAADAATEARYEYWDWIQSTYNCTFKEVSLGDWGTSPEELLNFINTQGEENRIFKVRPDSVSASMTGGLLYDMASLDCIDFSEAKWNAGVTAQMTMGDKVYGTAVGVSEPREVVFFNKRLVEAAGIDPESIYDLQANNEWTFAKFEELIAKCEQDTDNDGVIDVYGLAGGNNDDMLRVAVASNGGSFFDVVDGKYVVAANSDAAVEAMNWAQNVIVKYGQKKPSDDAEWNWFFAAFKNGSAAFHVGQMFEANDGADLYGMEDDFGVVCFPTGPKAEAGAYKFDVSENVTVMPGFYDADRAWKIGFVYNLYANDTPGFESANDPDAWKEQFYNRFRDTRAVDETYAILRKPESANAVISRNFGSDNDVLGQDFFWSIAGGTVTVAEAIETKMPAWEAYLATINK